MASQFDSFDMSLVRLLQEDAAQPLSALSEKTNLSPNACWRRVKKLEQLGVIIGRTIVIDHRKLGLGLTAFVSVQTSNHSTAWLERFARRISQIPQIVECHRMTGDMDYLLKLIAQDMEEYDAIYKRIIELPEISDVSGAFSMEALKIPTRFRSNSV